MKINDNPYCYRDLLLPLEIDCVRAHVGLGRQVEAKCVSTNNPIALQTCAIEYYDHMRSFPCESSVYYALTTYNVIHLIMPYIVVNSYHVHLRMHGLMIRTYFMYAGSVEADGSVKLSVPTYPPGLYNVTFTSTDVYGQTVNKTILLFLPRTMSMHALHSTI